MIKINTDTLIAILYCGLLFAGIFLEPDISVLNMTLLPTFGALYLLITLLAPDREDWWFISLVIGVAGTVAVWFIAIWLGMIAYALALTGFFLKNISIRSGKDLMPLITALGVTLGIGLLSDIIHSATILLLLVLLASGVGILSIILAEHRVILTASGDEP